MEQSHSVNPTPATQACAFVTHFESTLSRRDAIIHHITNFDLPADREQIVAIANACGWQWQWPWQGSHQAEALAALTPI
jgi:hypothetical protein